MPLSGWVLLYRSRRAHTCCAGFATGETCNYKNRERDAENANVVRNNIGSPGLCGGMRLDLFAKWRDRSSLWEEFWVFLIEMGISGGRECPGDERPDGTA